MTTPETEPQPVEAASAPDVSTAAPTPEVPQPEEKEQQDERKRRLLLLLLLLLLIGLCCVCALLGSYLLKPQPLPSMILPTQVSVCYPPTYQFSITGVDGPFAVALSPDGERVYAAEANGGRLVKVFDRDGNFVTSFAPPGTDKANREPKYMAVDPNGRVFLVDRTSSAIEIYDRDGVFIDAIIGQHMTLTKYLTAKIGALPDGTVITHYEGINKILFYRLPGQSAKSVKVTFAGDDPQWNPLGLRFDADGNLIYTDTTPELHSVHIIPAADLNGDLSVFNPDIIEFGSQGSENGQFEFPQTVVKDGDGNFYVADGNNARISVFTPEMDYKTFFAFGSAEGSLNLPRGLWMATGDCLVVADAVGGLIRVYNVSGDQPEFSFEIGGFGLEEGQFNYPIDVYIDGTGRLYIADRDNNRIQVWSY